MLDDVAVKALTGGIIALKAANPLAWGAFKTGLKAVAIGATELDKTLEDDSITSEELVSALQKVEGYGAARALQGVLWELIKHIKG